MEMDGRVPQGDLAFTFSIVADMQLPDRAHGLTHAGDEQLELLRLGETDYVAEPGDFRFKVDRHNESGAVFLDLLDPLLVPEDVEWLTDLELQPDETIDGRDYHRISLRVDMKDFIESLTDDNLRGVEIRGRAELLIDQETLLPHQFNVSCLSCFITTGRQLDLFLDFTLSEFDQRVDVPGLEDEPRLLPTPTLLPIQPTPTSRPTATRPAPTATARPQPTATPAAPRPTATAVPRATTATVPGAAAKQLVESAGYQSKWGEPKMGGIMKVGMPTDPTHFNPNRGSSAYGPMVMPQYNGLTRFDPWVGIDVILPDLARSWEFSSDGRKLTLNLEEGVTFQDHPAVPERLWNAELTCEDVQASVERHVRPPESEPMLTLGPSMLGHISSVVCPLGPLGHLVVLSMNEPKANTMAALSTGHMVIWDKDYLDWMQAEHPGSLDTATDATFKLNRGTGPFAPLEYTPDRLTSTRKSTSYWRDGLPLLDGIDFFVIKDPTTRFAALATGQIHLFGYGSNAMSPWQVAQAERDFSNRITLHRALYGFPYGIRFNLNRSPFNDVRVRKAIHLAIDRDAWSASRKAGSLEGAELLGTLAPGTFWSHSEAELRTWPGLRQPKDGDISQANRLLDEVFGSGNRFSTTCLPASSSQVSIDSCLFFADQMKKNLDIDVTLEVVESGAALRRTTGCDYDTVSGAQGSTYSGDPNDRLLGVFHRDHATSAYLCWLSGTDLAVQARLEAIIEAQSAELDPVRRRELTRTLDSMLTNDLNYNAMLGWTVIFYGTSPDLRGFHLYDYGALSYWPLYERLWLAR